MNEHSPESPETPAADVVPATPAAADGPVGVTPSPSRGARLRAARESAGLAQSEIAARLRLSLRQIQALEADEEAALPPAPFVRGFVRNYARAVGRDPLDFDPPAPERSAETAAESLPPLVLPAPERPIRLESGRASANRRWLGAALAALVLGVLGSWVRREHLDAAGVLIAQQAPSALGSLGALVGGQTPGRDAAPAAPAPGADTQADHSAPVTTEAPVAAPTTTASVASQPGAPLPGAPGAGSATVDAVSASGTRTLALDFDADCWVEVRDENNQVLLSGVSRAGDHRDVEAHGPLRIVVGNAPATRLSWNGKPVDLAEFTRVTVARLTLDPSVEHP